MARIVETLSTYRHDPGTAEEVVQKLVAMGWEVAEEQNGETLLIHELLPGSTRIVSAE